MCRHRGQDATFAGPHIDILPNLVLLTTILTHEVTVTWH